MLTKLHWYIAIIYSIVLSLSYNYRYVSTEERAEYIEPFNDERILNAFAVNWLTVRRRRISGGFSRCEWRQVIRISIKSYGALSDINNEEDSESWSLVVINTPIFSCFRGKGPALLKKTPGYHYRYWTASLTGNGINRTWQPGTSAELRMVSSRQDKIDFVRKARLPMNIFNIWIKNAKWNHTKWRFTKIKEFYD